MKDILVEFRENGAIVHKDRATIQELVGKKHCFLNPNLSRVAGVSPSYWMLDQYEEIVPCTEEEMQRRDSYHRATVIVSKAPTETLNTNDLKSEFKQKFQMNEELLRFEINRIKQEISDNNKNSESRLALLKEELAKSEILLSETKQIITDVRGDLAIRSLRADAISSSLQSEMVENEKKLVSEIEALKEQIKNNDQHSQDNLNDLFYDLARNKELLIIANATIEEHQETSKKRVKMGVISLIVLAVAITALAIFRF
jgi:hypothetical protein